MPVASTSAWQETSSPFDELHDPVRILAAQADHRLADQHLGAEPPRLRRRALREVGAGHARGKAEVVLDHRAGPGLPARRVLLDQQHVQPFRRGVDGVRQPRRARRR